jgi:hypothetical protein
MNTSPVHEPDPILTKRRLGIASIAAVLGCAAWCAIPLLGAAGLGSVAFSRLAWAEGRARNGRLT